MGEAVSTLKRRILNAMGIFGGTQVAVVALSVLRNKLMALWLGPAGVGLNAIYTTTRDLMQAGAGLSLRTGAVREIAAAPVRERPAIEGAVRSVSAALALAGAAITLLLSPALSYWTIGTPAQWWCFALLATAVGAAIWLESDMAALQGEGHIAPLARVTLLSAIVATAAAVPLYYGLRLQAVLPVYLLMTYAYALWAARERRRYCPLPARVPLRDAWRTMAPVLRLGLYLTAAAVLTQLASYLFVVFMAREDGTGGLGLYQSGFMLVNTYVLVVFSAITNEYYPRLASVASSGMRTAAFAGGEFKVAAWVLMPVVVTFVVLSEPVVLLLYSRDFLDVLPYVDLGICGVLPRAFSYCMAFVILARGDGRVFVATEAAGAVLGLACSIIGYRLGGFPGLGAGYVVEYLLYSAVVLLAIRRYGLRMSLRPVLLCAGATLLCLAAVLLKHLWGPWIAALATLPWLLPLAFHVLRGKKKNYKSYKSYKSYK
ncbi:MAG: oligosaccharide flippase family protein [Muribaculaceae bacterium]|nr:oligosaccharide flippase family protein [Muribaculaceae bacterium]